MSISRLALARRTFAALPASADALVCWASALLGIRGDINRPRSPRAPSCTLPARRGVCPFWAPTLLGESHTRIVRSQLDAVQRCSATRTGFFQLDPASWRPVDGRRASQISLPSPIIASIRSAVPRPLGHRALGAPACCSYRRCILLGIEHRRPWHAQHQRSLVARSPMPARTLVSTPVRSPVVDHGIKVGPRQSGRSPQAWKRLKRPARATDLHPKT